MHASLAICRHCPRRLAQICTLSRSPVYWHATRGECPDGRYPLINTRRSRQRFRCRGPIRVGLASYGHYVGGVEEWFRCLVAGNTDSEVVYTAIGVIDPSLLGRGNNVDLPFVRHESLHKYCDVILGWSTDLSHLCDWPGRIVYVAHGQTAWTASCVHRSLSIADAVVAVSESSRRVIQAPDDWITIIRNGVDLDRLPTPQDRRQKIATIGYLGRWDADKRPHLAAEAAGVIGCRAAYLVPQHQRDSALLALAAHSQLIDWYDTSQLKEFLSTISVLIVPSCHEGGPLVVAEAWAAGVPVAATSVGMIPELERLHGKLVIPLSNPPTPDELASLLSSVDPLTVSRACSLARTELTKSRMSAEYAALFHRLYE